MAQFLTQIQRIFIYQDAGAEPIDYLKLKLWLEKILVEKNLVEIRKNSFSFHLSSLSVKARAPKIEQIAEELARIRVRNPDQRSFPQKATQVEIDFESRNLQKEKKSSAVIYDAYEFMKVLADLIPKKEKGLPFLHLIITEQMLASFEGKDRYHLRSAFFGYPSIISSTGLVEAPARPREYYIKVGAGIPKELALAELGEAVLHRNDPRMTEVLQGCLLQALFYQILGNPHCDNRDCQLFNAHWQEELLNSQLKGKLCRVHKKMLSNYIKRM